MAWWLLTNARRNVWTSKFAFNFELLVLLQKARTFFQLFWKIHVFRVFVRPPKIQTNCLFLKRGARFIIMKFNFSCKNSFLLHDFLWTMTKRHRRMKIHSWMNGDSSLTRWHWNGYEHFFYIELTRNQSATQKQPRISSLYKIELTSMQVLPVT